MVWPIKPDGVAIGKNVRSDAREGQSRLGQVWSDGKSAKHAQSDSKKKRCLSVTFSPLYKLNTRCTFDVHSRSIVHTECSGSLSLASLSSCDSIVRVSTSDSLALFTSPFPLCVSPSSMPRIYSKFRGWEFWDTTCPMGRLFLRTCGLLGSLSSIFGGTLKLDPGTKAGRLRFRVGFFWGRVCD